MKNISRRIFIKTSALISAFTIGAAIFTRSVIWPNRKEIYDEYISINTPEKFGLLNDEELKLLYSFSELLYLPADEMQKEILNGTVRRWVNARTKTDGFFSNYKRGVSAIEIISKSKGYNTPFTELAYNERLNIMKEISTKRPTIDDHPVFILRYTLNSLFNRNIFSKIYYLSFIKEDLIKGIYSSQLGWSLVGYSTWPGVPGDPLEYTAPPPTLKMENI